MSCVILFLGHIMPSQCFQSSILLTLNSWVNWRLPQSQRTRLGGSWLTRHKTEQSRRSVTARKREPESTRIEPCAARGWPELRMSSLRKQRLGPRWRRRPECVSTCLRAATPSNLGSPPEASADQFFGWSFWVSPPGASVAGVAPGVAAPSVPGAGVAPGAAPPSVPGAGVAGAGAVAVMMRV